MQKKIIALAVAGLASTAAFAQTNVTVYGIADAGVAYVNTNANNANGRDAFQVVSGGIAGSRLGFKGTEDLGNGLKAVFVLEQGFNIDNGTTVDDRTGGTGAFQRQAFVGLSGKVGTLSLGRQYSPGYYASAAYDTIASSPFLSPLIKTEAGISSTIIAASSARWNNTVNFQTANFGGVEVQGIYRMGEQFNEIALGEGYGVGVKYAGGPVSVSYVYHHSNNGTSGPAVGVNTAAQEEHFLGLGVDLKVVKLTATAQVSDWGNRSVAGRANTGEAYSIGAIVPVGKGNIHAAASYADLNGNKKVGGAGGQITSAAVAYTYGLSKRTTLYTGLNYTDATAGTSLAAITTNTGAYGAGVATAGAITTTFAAGINHQF